MSDENTVGGVNVDVTANLGQYRADMAGAKAETEAFDKAATASAARVKEAFATLSTTQQFYAKIVRDGKMSMDELTAALGKGTAAKKDLAAITAALTSLQDKETVSKVENKIATDADTAAVLKNRAAYEGMVAIHEILSGRLNRLPGTLMVAANAQMGASASAAMFNAIISPTGLLVAGVAGAMIAMTVAMEKGGQEFAKYQNDLKLTGNYAGQTAAELDKMAHSIGQSSGYGTGNAAAALGAVVGSGRVSGDAVGSIADASVRLAALTHQHAAKVAEELSKMASDPARAARDLNEQYHFLTEAEMEHIEALTRTGDKQQALNELMGKFDTTLKGETQQFGLLEGAIHGAHQAFDAFWQGMKDAGKPATAEELTSQIANLRPGRGQSQEDYLQTLNALRAKLKTLQDKDAADKKQHDDSVRHQEAIDAADDLNAQLSGLKTNHQRALEEIQRYHDQAKKILADPTTGPEARANATYALSHESLLNARINQRYAGGKMPKTSDPYGDQVNKDTQAASSSLALAKAYGESAAAATAAEAAERALAEAVNKGWTEAQKAKLVQLELNKETAKNAADTAKKAFDLNADAAAQEKANAAYMAGTMTAKQASDMVKVEKDNREQLAVADKASAETKAALRKAIDDQAAAQARLNAATDNVKVQPMLDADKDRLAQINLELSLLGQTQRVRDEATAKAKANDQLDKANVTDPAARARAVSSAGTIANRESDLQSGQSFDQTKRSIDEQIAAMVVQAQTYGMSAEKATAYKMVQDEINKADAAGKPLTDEQIAQLKALADQYARTGAAIQEMTRKQLAAKDAAGELSHQFGDLIIGLADGSEKGAQALHNLVHSIDTDALKGVLEGQGPFAGILGTNKPGANGGLGGGILNTIFGKAFGLPAGAGSDKPSGTAMDPIYTKSADMTGAGGGGLGGLFSMIGGSSGVGVTAPAGLDSLAGLFHTGTNYVGTPSSTIRVPPSLFVGAPRFHNGLAPDEFPAILQRGERVVPRNGRSSGGLRDVHVHMTTPNGGAFGRSPTQVARETHRQMQRVRG